MYNKRNKLNIFVWSALKRKKQQRTLLLFAISHCRGHDRTFQADSVCVKANIKVQTLSCWKTCWSFFIHINHKTNCGWNIVFWTVISRLALWMNAKQQHVFPHRQHSTVFQSCSLALKQTAVCAVSHHRETISIVDSITAQFHARWQKVEAVRL